MKAGSILTLALAAALSAAAPSAGAAQEPLRPDSVGATISGTVRGSFQGQSELLPFAVVRALAPGTRRSVVADSLGRYTFDGLPGGPVRLTVTHPGHAPLTVDVIVPRTGGSVLVDLELRARPVELAPLDVTGGRPIADPDRREAEPGDMARVDVAVLEAGPAVGAPGLANAVGAMPGNDPADPTDVLFMRGSTADLKLVLLNGAPVFTPFHVAGLLRSFEPAVLDRADLHVGGAPARYDGGLTSILDLRTRRPLRDRLRASGAVDLLSSSGAVEGPLGGRAGFLASGRTLHSVGNGVLGGETPYGYRDLLLGAEVEPAADHLIRATGFWNREAVNLDLPTTLGVAAALVPEDASWSNRAVSVEYRGRVGELFVDITAAASAYRASLPLQPTAPSYEPVPDPLLASAATDRTRFVAEAARSVPGGMLRFGASYEALDASYDARAPAAGLPSVNTRSSASAGGAFADASWTVRPELSLRAGLRADHFSGPDEGWRVAPRASLSWSLGPEAVLTVAAGRYHQHARATDMEVERALTEVVEDSLSSTELLPVATADHVILSLDQTLGESVRMGLSGYWKGYSGLRAAPDERIRSSGVDLRIQRLGEDLTAWLGYGLNWFWSTRDLAGYAADFAGRHLLTAGLSGRLTGPFSAEARATYGAGLPYTSIPFGSRSDLAAADPEGLGGTGEVLEQSPPLVGGLDDSFLRVDLEVHATLEPEWGGHRWQIRPYLRVLNALNQRDALFVAFQPWRGEGPTPLAERPFLPVLGVSFRY